MILIYQEAVEMIHSYSARQQKGKYPAVTKKVTLEIW